MSVVPGQAVGQRLLKSLFVSGLTQEHGQTDLVLSCGLSVFNTEVYDATFSDHMSVYVSSYSPVIKIKHVLQLSTVYSLHLGWPCHLKPKLKS